MVQDMYVHHSKWPYISDNPARQGNDDVADDGDVLGYAGETGRSRLLIKQ
jgi:hypothetical protein